MINITILTILAFGSFLNYEMVKVANFRSGSNRKNINMKVGLFALVVCWIAGASEYWNSGNLFGVSFGTRVIVGAIAIILSVAFYVYILWFALPKGTYDDEVQSELMSTGIYGICRHPGFYGFTLTALSVAFLVGSKEMLILMLIHSALNLGYIILQDAIYFPAYLEGYDEYKKQVRFL